MCVCLWGRIFVLYTPAHLSSSPEGDGHAGHGKPVNEVRGAVDGVDDPRRGVRQGRDGACVGARLLADELVLREALPHRVEDQLLVRLVRFRHPVRCMSRGNDRRGVRERDETTLLKGTLVMYESVPKQFPGCSFVAAVVISGGGGGGGGVVVVINGGVVAGIAAAVSKKNILSLSRSKTTASVLPRVNPRKKRPKDETAEHARDTCMVSKRATRASTWTKTSRWHSRHLQLALQRVGGTNVRFRNLYFFKGWKER